MRNFVLPKKQKGVFGLSGIVIIAIIVIVGLVIFFALRQPKGEKLQITPSQLMPEVSASEARATICNLKKEELFVEACQEKFNAVGQEDAGKIVELFTLLEKIKNDKSISNYDRMLLAQVVFAALPNKDSSEAYLYQPAFLSRLFIRPGIAFAQGQIMTEEEFKEMMRSDLKTMVDGLPKGDNTWTIMVMVSKYTWVDGKRQPIYSQTFSEHFEDFPGNPNPPDPRNITYHVQARVGNRMTGQTVDIGLPTYKGTSEMLAYSFTIVSWEMPEYTHPDGSKVDYEYTPVHRNYSENFYRGEHYINELLADVKMPPPPRSVGSYKDKSKSDEQATQPGELVAITCEEWKSMGFKKKCPAYVAPYDQSLIWCANSPDEIHSYAGGDEWVEGRGARSGASKYMEAHSPTYARDFDLEDCK